MWFWVVYVCLSVLLIEFALHRASPLRHAEVEFAGTVKYSAYRRKDTNQWSRLHLYLFGVPLLLPRFLLILFCVFIHGVTATVLLCGQNLNPDTPLPPTRQKLLKYSSFFWTRVLMLSAGFWRVQEQGTADPRATTLVCNHTSYFDILYFLTASEFPSFLANEGVKRMPLIGKIAQAMQCVFVDRSNTSDRNIASTLVQNRQLDINSAKGFPKLLLFPEGTTTNGSGVVMFRKGAFVTGAVVQGVAIRYPFAHMSPTFESIPMLPHVILMCCQAYNQMVVTRLPILQASAPTPEERALLVRQQIANHLQIPLLQDTFNEKFEFIAHVFKQKIKHS